MRGTLLPHADGEVTTAPMGKRAIAALVAVVMVVMCALYRESVSFRVEVASVTTKKASALVNTTTAANASSSSTGTSTQSPDLPDPTAQSTEVPIELDSVTAATVTTGAPTTAPTTTLPMKDASKDQIGANVRRITLRDPPYNNLGTFTDAACQWVNSSSDTTSEQQEVFSRLVGETPDVIQAQAMTDGVCLLENATIQSNLHVFSTEEAKECLHNATLIMGGDSYNRQLYIGLSDILLGAPDNIEITDGTMRNKFLKEKKKLLENARNADPASFPDVRWSCHNECYGKRLPFCESCSPCLQQEMQSVERAIPVIGTMVHISKGYNRSLAMTVDDLSRFFNLTPGLIYNSQPSTDTKRIPILYQNESSKLNIVYRALLGTLKDYPMVNFLDYYQLTRTCYWDNCSFDGGHRSRFVNRWKAQLLLNTLCSVTSGVDVESTDSSDKPNQPSQVTKEKIELNHATTSEALATNDAYEVQMETAEASKPRITLRSYPYNNLGTGIEAACHWAVNSSATTSDQGRLASLVGEGGTPDLIQTQALTEGVCLLENGELQSKIHLFSTEEAKECLYNATLVMGGDSYNRQLYIGLSDILLGAPENIEITNGTMRNTFLEEKRKLLEQARNADPSSFPDVRWPCQLECYGKTLPFYVHCSACLRGVMEDVQRPTPVIGTMVHISKGYNRSLEMTVDDLSRFFNLTPGLIYNSQPSYDIARVPILYQNDSAKRNLGYEALLNMSKSHPQVNFLDYYQLTRTCHWDNCSYDGGHRSRYVNRWKAQLLLNTLCSVTTDGTVGSTIVEDTVSPATSEPTDIPVESKATMPPDQIDSSTSKRRVQLRDSPYKHLGSGIDAACQWSAKTPETTTSEQEVFSRLVGATPDLIQSSAVAEGVCLLENAEMQSSLHVFSTDEAKECLYNATLLLGGDSYNRQLFIGLSDILMGVPENIEITSGTMRNTVLSEKLKLLEDARSASPETFPDVRWSCHLECYGTTLPFYMHCSACLRQVMEGARRPIPVVGTMVHINKGYNRSLKMTVHDLAQFFNMTPGLVYTSQPAYNIERVPLQHQNSTMELPAVYTGLVKMSKDYPMVNFLDYFQLTRTCYWDNCSFDGGHRSRFVNRWKAQLLLNTLCSVS